MNAFCPVEYSLNQHLERIDDADSFNEYRESRIDEVVEKIISNEGYKLVTKEGFRVTYNMSDVTENIYGSSEEVFHQFDELLSIAVRPDSKRHQEGLMLLREMVIHHAKKIAETLVDGELNNASYQV